MHLTILGTNGPYPAAGGACSGYLLESGDARIMLDAGAGTLAALTERVPVERLSALMISHWHFDHMSDLLPLLYALSFSNRTEPLPVYAPEPPEPVRALLSGQPVRLNRCSDVQIGPLQVRFAPMFHPAPCFGARFEEGGRAFVYTGDTNMHPDLDAFVAGADVLLADAGLMADDWHAEAPHLSAALCGQLAARTGVGRLILTHIAPQCAPEAVLAEARAHFPGAELARRGMRHTL